MRIEGSVALVTGARRGMGREFVRQLQDRGARRVYAAVRDRSDEPIDGAQLIRLDVSDPGAAERAAAEAADVSLLVNNAGVTSLERLVAGDLDAVHREFDTNFYGTLHVIRAFAPVLARQGGGAILNMLSALSWRAYLDAGGYGASKAAAWSLTDAVRLELASQGTLVTGLHVGAVDTDMMAGFEIPKADPRAVVRAGLDAVASGQAEIVVDETAAQAKATLGADPAHRYPELSAR